jgi:F0F1-type ATP synthase membrane subunit c/vacuolar-type H+-ATPase subunit K
MAIAMKGITMSNEQKEPRSDKPKMRSTGYWIAIGLAIGAGIGVALDNLAIGIAIGVAIGVALGAAQSQRDKDK